MFYHEKDIRKFEAHPLQFTVWRFSGKSRVIVECVATILLAIIIHIFVNFVLRAVPQFDEDMAHFLLVEEQFENTP
jgi:ABC-type phosphate transport system permease subunit